MANAKDTVEAVKTAAAKKMEETVEAVKTAVEAVPAKIEEAKTEEAPAEEVKPERKRPGRKPGSKNKTTKAKEKAIEKKEAGTPEIYVQFGASESSVQAAVERIRAEYIAQGHRASSIKTLKIYLKPEDNAAYYVINEKVAGRVDLF